MYADVTTFSDINSSKEIMERNLQNALHILEEWCHLNGMVLNTDKTKVIFITTPHRRTKAGDSQLNIFYKNVKLKVVTGDKLLGINIHENMKWDDHINNIRKKVASNLWLLSKIKTFTSRNHQIIFYKAYIQPHLDFCNVIWGGTGKTNLDKLFLLQKRAFKIILGPEYTSFPEALEKINALSIHQRILIQKAKFMYKVHQNLLPTYILEMFEYRKPSNTALRSISNTDFQIPRPRIELFKETMSYSGPMIWNKIPIEIRSSCTLNQFTKKFISWIKD
jgi:hypothetical protein